MSGANLGTVIAACSVREASIRGGVKSGLKGSRISADTETLAVVMRTFVKDGNQPFRLLSVFYWWATILR